MSGLAGGLTVIIPFYRNCGMLTRQLQEWRQYPESVAVLVVDDGSPEPALPIIEAAGLRQRVGLLRVIPDIPWNRNGARNLGSAMATTMWILHMDIDHVLPVASLAVLLEKELDPECFYRFARFRVGKADATRRKDKVPEDAEFAQIKPHGDSYACTRLAYWRAGGYNEDFSGCLGGGSPFQKMLEAEVRPQVLEDVPLHVYTRDKISDASDFSLSRDTTEYARRKAAMGGNYRGKNPLRFNWEKVL